MRHGNDIRPVVLGEQPEGGLQFLGRSVRVGVVLGMQL